MICTKCRQPRSHPAWWPNVVPGTCPAGGGHDWVTPDRLEDDFATGLNAFSPLGLTPAGRPVLEDCEVELVAQDGVALYRGDHQSDYQDGTLVVTTHRILYIERGPKRSLALVLAAVAGTERRGAYTAWSSPKIVLNVAGLPPGRHVMCSFRSGGADAAWDRLQAAIAKKAWEAGPPAKAAFSTTAAGVAGIMRTAEAQERKTRVAVETAFEDLTTLMGSASELMAIARRLQSHYERDQHSEEEAEQFHQQLMGLGLASPVSRATVGSSGDYHAELSRQLCDFLQSPLQQCHGALSLVDVYGLYNRARGSDLISPDDLLKACKLFGPLHLPLTLRTFPSGVMIVQSQQLHPEHVAEAVAGALEGSPHVTPLRLGELLGVPIALATEYLVDLEKAGSVCRDDGLEGLAFYRNFFRDPALAAAIRECLLSHGTAA